MIGRDGTWRATGSKPAWAKVEANPVPDALGVRVRRLPLSAQNIASA